MNEKKLTFLKNLLNSQQGVTDFRLVSTHTSSYELFFVHGKLETVRSAEHSAIDVTVYAAHDGKLGNSSFGVDSAMPEEQIRAKLQRAVNNARRIFDAPYELVSDGAFEAELPSALSALDPCEVAAAVGNAVYGANAYENCDINALEVFVTKKTLRVQNSKGLDKTQTAHTISVEAIPTANGEKESVELFEAYVLGEPDLDWLKNEIALRIDDACARLVAKKPDYPIDVPVVLGPYELTTLFEEIIGDCNFASVYNQVNVLSKGDLLQSAPEGDKLNITVRGRMDGSPQSAYFDLDGVQLEDRQIVKDGRIVALYGANRFAQYLGERPTGLTACIDVEGGKTPEKEILAAPHLELVYLSGLQVDRYNDYIGGEIRLAYYFDGKKRVPVTGIAMSGKLSEALNKMTLSAELTTLGAYRGPAKVALEGIKIF